MYLRKIKRKNKNGSTVEYYQLAHNERHSETGKSVAKVIHSFGRADELDRDELVQPHKILACPIISKSSKPDHWVASWLSKPFGSVSA